MRLKAYLAELRVHPRHQANGHAASRGRGDPQRSPGGGPRTAIPRDRAEWQCGREGRELRSPCLRERYCRRRTSSRRAPRRSRRTPVAALGPPERSSKRRRNPRSSRRSRKGSRTARRRREKDASSRRSGRVWAGGAKGNVPGRAPCARSSEVGSSSLRCCRRPRRLPGRPRHETATAKRQEADVNRGRRG